MLSASRLMSRATRTRASSERRRGGRSRRPCRRRACSSRPRSPTCCRSRAAGGPTRFESAMRIAPRIRACRFSSVVVRSIGAERRRERRAVGVEHGADRDLEEPDAEAPRELARVAQASRRGVRARHRDADDPVGAERLDRERRRDRRVDAAREPEHGARESRTSRRSRRAPGRAPGAPGERPARVGASGAAPPGRSTVQKSSAKGARGRRGGPARRTRGAAVEDEAVVAADEVAGDERHAGSPRDPRMKRSRRRSLPSVSGRRGDVDVQVEPERAQVRHRVGA